MTTDFRALCAELMEAFDEAAPGINQFRDLRDRADAALANAPAAREPVAVTGQPSDEDLNELMDSILWKGSPNRWGRQVARAVLARWGSPAPAPPADGEVAELVAWLQETGDTIQPSHLAEHQRYKRAAELLLQRQALVPVAVSERPPGPEDCDAEGRCWWGTPGFVNSYTVAQSAQWRLSTPDDRFGSELFWLPAHALPLPEVGE